MGLLRGVLASWSGTAESGELRMTLESGEGYACAFDARTFFDRERSRIHASRLRAGDQLEVMSDRTGAGTRCFARMVRVLTATHGSSAFTWGRIVRATDHFAPRGEVEFSGVLARLADGYFVLRTRSGTRHLIHFRPDTRFMSNGQAVDRSGLAVNDPVFVRSGTNLDDELEAFQVISGASLQPNPLRSRR
jgi:hypothetical protein